MNSLRRGRYPKSFGETRSKAGPDVEILDWIGSRIFDGFQPRSAPERRQAERLAREVWCQGLAGPPKPLGRRRAGPSAPPGAYLAPRQAGFERLAGMSRATVWCLAWTPWRLGRLETRPRYSLKSADSCVTSPSRIPIRDRITGRLAREARCPPGRCMRPAGFETKPIYSLESTDARAGLQMRISPDSEFDKPKLVYVIASRGLLA